jgi:hypothetical protein
MQKNYRNSWNSLIFQDYLLIHFDLSPSMACYFFVLISLQVYFIDQNVNILDLDMCFLVNFYLIYRV